MTQYFSCSMKPSGLNTSQCHVTYSCTSVETFHCWQKYLYSKGTDKRTETSWWSFSGLEGQVWRSHWAPVAPGWVKWKSLSHVQLFATPWIVVHGILQARILEWVAFPFSRGSSQPRDQTHVSNTVGRFFTSWATGMRSDGKLQPWLRVAHLPCGGDAADLQLSSCSGCHGSHWLQGQLQS